MVYYDTLTKCRLKGCEQTYYYLVTSFVTKDNGNYNAMELFTCHLHLGGQIIMDGILIFVFSSLN